MPREVIDVSIEAGAGRTVTAEASTGDWACANLWDRFRQLLIYTDFVGSGEGIRLGFCPRILYVYWFDVSASGTAQWNDLLGDDKAILNGSQHATDQKTITAMASGDFVYVATEMRHGGLFWNIQTNVNNNAATIAATHSGRGGWTAITITTDGTASGGATLAVDGTMEMDTVPAADTWVKKSLAELLGGTADGLPEAPRKTELYWSRWAPSATLNNVTIRQMSVLDPETSQTRGQGTVEGGAIFLEGDTEYVMNIREDRGGIQFISQDANAQTPKLSWLRR